MRRLGLLVACGGKARLLFLVQLRLDFSYKLQKVVLLVDAELLVYVEGVGASGAVGYAELPANVGAGEALRQHPHDLDLALR